MKLKSLSLVEVILAIMLLSMIALSIYPSWISSVSSSKTTETNFNAFLVAHSLLNGIQNDLPNLDENLDVKTATNGLIEKKAVVSSNTYQTQISNIKYDKTAIRFSSATAAIYGGINAPVSSTTATQSQIDVAVNVIHIKQCNNVPNPNNDLVFNQDGYITVMPNGDNVISYSVQFVSEVLYGGLNQVRLILPNTITKINANTLSYINLYYTTNPNSLGNRYCDLRGTSARGNIPSTSSVIDLRDLGGAGNGANLTIDTITSSIATYVIIPKLQDSKIYWQMVVGFKFDSQSLEYNKYVTFMTPQLKYSATAPVVYVPGGNIFETNPVQDWVGWDKAIFSLSSNANAHVSVSCYECAQKYNFIFNKEGTNIIWLSALNLPNKMLVINATVYPIDITKPASISGITVYYYKKE